VLSQERKLELLHSFDHQSLLAMMFSEEGNYIVQCFVLNLAPELIAWFVPLVDQKVLQLCRDKRGCRVIQRMLEKFPREVLRPVIDKIISAAIELTPQQYGNYVITHILQNGQNEEKTAIMQQLQDKILSLSLIQLGSNVVEACLKTELSPYKENILDRIINMPPASPVGSPEISFANLLENQFGNYVI